MQLIHVRPAIMVRILEKAGFLVKRQTGSHIILYKLELKRPISVPMHSGDLPTGTQRAILRQAQISLEDFEKLFRSL